MSKLTNFRVEKINGILVDENDMYLHIEWTDNMESWENVYNIQSRDNLAILLRSIDSAIIDLKKSKEKIANEATKKDLLGQLSFLKKLSKIENENHKSDTKEKLKNLQDKNNTFNTSNQKISGQNKAYNNLKNTNSQRNSDDSRLYSMNVSSVHQNENINMKNKENRVFQKKKAYLETKSGNIKYPRFVDKKVIKSNKTKIYDSKHNVSIFNNKNIPIDSKSARVFTRYFQKDSIENTENEKSNIFIAKEVDKNDSRVFFGDYHVSMITDIYDIHRDILIDKQDFRFKFSVSRLFLYIYIHSNYQNPNLFPCNTFRSTMINATNMFYNEMHRLKIKKICPLNFIAGHSRVKILSIIDDVVKQFCGTEHHFYIFSIPKKYIVDAMQIKEEDILSICFKTDEKRFSEASIYDNIKINLEDFIHSRKGKNIFFNNFLQIHFGMRLHKFSLPIIFKYFILSRYNEFIIIELNKFLVKNAHIKVSVSNRDADVVFILFDHIEFLISLPFFEEMKLNKTKFLVINPLTFISKDFVTEIYRKGGLITIHIDLIPQFIEINNIIKVIDAIKNSNGLWGLKIRQKTLIDFKQYVANKSGSLMHKHLSEIYDYFKICSDQIDCETDVEYMQILESLHYKEKRYFYLMNASIDGDFVKTPENILKIMEKCF